MLRTATADDLPAIATVEGRAFGSHYDDTDLTDFRPLFEPERFLLGCDPDDGHILGVTGAFGFQLTLPGAAVVDAPGVSWVSVSTTHRRRGILRTLMLAQHEGFVADGYPVALLYASEGGIYGRFGYGPATARHAVEIDRRFAAFRPDAPDPGGVAQVDTAAIRCAGPEIHRRWCAHTPGALDRSPVWWANVLLDREHRRGGASALFHLLHADGYASYRIQDADRTCRVVELFAVTDRAYVALWRVLLGLDLVHTVTTMACARRPAAVPAHRPTPGPHHRARRRDVGQGARCRRRARRPPVRVRGRPGAGCARLFSEPRWTVPAARRVRRGVLRPEYRRAGRAPRHRRARLVVARRPPGQHAGQGRAGRG